MQIQQLQPGQKITLQVSANEHSLSFESVVQEVNPRKHTIYADAVLQGDKPISFRGKGIILDVIATVNEEEKPILFKNVASTLLKKADGTFCYSLSTIVESVVYNRRKNYRCYVGLETSLRLGPNRAAYSAIIRDVSSTGFSVVCEKSPALGSGQLVHAVLNDQIEDCGKQYLFHLYGLVVRTQELENGNTVYGCRLNSPVHGLDSYIYQKERFYLKKNTGFTSRPLT